MKKVFRYLLILIGIILVLAGGFAGYVAIRGIPKYKVENVPNLTVASYPDRLLKGQKLASMLCAHCHLDPNTGKFSGRKMEEVPQFGTIYAKNITQHTEAGIGRWTDGELTFLLRTGLKPDGTYLPPYMIKLVHMSDEDLQSIIAFLRSDHEWVQPSEVKQPNTKPSFLTKFLSNIGVAKPFDYPKEQIPDPDTTNMITWGKYLANAQLECYACHSADFAKNDNIHPEKSKGFYAGGNKMIGEGGQVIYSRNITMDEETGIGKWTEEQFLNAVKYGKVPHGKPLREPMQPYSRLTDNEVKAIYAYLKTVPKIKNEIEKE